MWDLSREDDMVLTSSGIGDDSHREPVSKVIWVPDTSSLKKNKYLVRLIHSQSIFSSKLLKNSPIFFLNSDGILNSWKKLHLIRSNFINNECLWFQLVSVSSDGKMLVWKMDRKTKQIELHDGYEFFLRFLSDL